MRMLTAASNRLSAEETLLQMKATHAALAGIWGGDDGAALFQSTQRDLMKRSQEK